MLEPGASLPRSIIEERVHEHARRRGETYRIRSDDGRAAAARLVTRGTPFKAPLLGGGAYDFGDVLGTRPAVVVFWASWCDPCRDEAPHLVRLYRTYQPRGIELVAVSIDDPSDHNDLRRTVEELALPYPVVLDPDGSVLAQYAQDSAIPLTFVIDRSGAVVYSHRNYRPGDEAALERAIIDVLD